MNHFGYNIEKPKIVALSFFVASLLQGDGCFTSALLQLSPTGERTLMGRERHATRIFWKSSCLVL